MDKLKFKHGDDISFDGSIDSTKEVFYSGIRSEEEKDPVWHGESTITRVLVANPRSHFRVKGFNYPYYVCEKLWESGDEEIPVGGIGVYIHMDEAIPYDKSWEGTIINKRK